MGKLGSFGAGIGVGVALAVSIGAAAQGTKLSEETVAQLRRLAEVFGAVKKTYAGHVDEKKLIDGCIRGLVRSTDPYGAYYDREEFEDLKASPRNPRGGIGIEIGSSGGRVAVVSAIEGAPADRAGIVSGDIIVRVDDTDTAGLSLTEVAKFLGGAPGSAIRLTLSRAAGPSEVKLTRELIRVRTVRSRLLAGGIGYVRIVQFRDDSPALVQSAFEQMKASNGGPLNGLVLDLRDNPGGILSAGVAVAAMFLPDGLVVVSTEGRDEESRQRYTSTRDSRPAPELAGIPLAVLVNGGSAAASEIVAAALQDHKRATIVGEKTYGRGSIQTILPFYDNTAIKLTTGYSRTPAGNAIQGRGVAPDVAAAARSRSPQTSYGDASDEALKRAVEVMKR